MTLRPCIDCGEPSAGTRCDEHQPTDTRLRRALGQAAYDPVWRALSQRARKAQPWCDDCGTDRDLTTDHVIPKTIAPELVHAPENLAVRCRPCNASRGATGWTIAEAHAVLARLTATYRRRPTRLLRERINAAQRAIQTRGTGVNRPTATPAARRRAGYTPPIGSR
ncbi:HNH endonuclease [Mycolicibacterium bacteremicum]|uniref:HNH endonuclease n=1 Tax=Mycolicibacterium bacteremicum TaxID=564198 RepID=UPI0026F26CB8|nr:HNH endonuclease [Mycolicibacterium bacteremicum]